MQLNAIDLQKEYDKDMKSGIGFPITNIQGIDPKTKKKNIDGLFSPLFGTDFTDETEYIQRYTCECGNKRGKAFQGEKCDLCDTEVKFENNDIEKTGWISLEKYKIIHPIFFNTLCRLIGETNLNNILKFNKELNKDGQYIFNADEYDPKNPFYNIGMEEFIERFDEILEYYTKNLKKEKKKYLEFIQNNREALFTQKIPVFSIQLRPVIMIKNSVLYADINKKYSLLLGNVIKLNKRKNVIDTNPAKVFPLLYETQMIFNTINDTVLNLIGVKGGHIRDSILASRVNFSSRAVIVPQTEKYEIDEIVMPYLWFLEMYKFELINLISRTDKIPLQDAFKRWNLALLNYDKRIVELCNIMIRSKPLYVLINRNPTLNYGSILCMKVAGIKEDYNDYTMAINSLILGLLSGDYDGDVLNIYGLKDLKVAEVFDDVFNPKRMFINKDNGRFNKALSLAKDQSIGLYSFYNN